jgi:hypothetical protein
MVRPFGVLQFQQAQITLELAAAYRRVLGALQRH